MARATSLPLYSSTHAGLHADGVTDVLSSMEGRVEKRSQKELPARLSPNWTVFLPACLPTFTQSEPPSCTQGHILRQVLYEDLVNPCWDRGGDSLVPLPCISSSPADSQLLTLAAAEPARCSDPYQGPAMACSHPSAAQAFSVKCV